jgi:serine/threonine protein kinase
MNIPPPIVFASPAGFGALARPLAPPVAAFCVAPAVLGGRSMPAPTFRMPSAARHPLEGRSLTSTDRRTLGAGAGGQVFRCTLEGARYIVKTTDKPEQRLMFDNEIDTFRRLKPHANICAPVAVAVVDGKRSMLFRSDTVPTSTIAERAASLPPNDQLAALQAYMRDLLTGLLAMQEQGFTHNDVKPANSVFNEKTHRFQLIDMGLATLASSLDPRSSQQVLEHQASRHGDPDFIPPELRKPTSGNHRLTAEQTLQSMGVYSVGCLLHDWLDLADERFEKVHGGKPSATLAAGDPAVKAWMDKRESLGGLARQMLKTDPGERPLLKAALRVVTPTSIVERAAERKVLARLAATT